MNDVSAESFKSLDNKLNRPVQEKLFILDKS